MSSFIPTDSRKINHTGLHHRWGQPEISRDDFLYNKHLVHLSKKSFTTCQEKAWLVHPRRDQRLRIPTLEEWRQFHMEWTRTNKTQSIKSMLLLAEIRILCITECLVSDSRNLFNNENWTMQPFLKVNLKMYLTLLTSCTVYTVLTLGNVWNLDRAG